MHSAAATSESRPGFGIALLVGALILLPGMDAIAKLLSRNLPTLEIAWARYLFHTLAIVPVAYHRHGHALLRAPRASKQLLRGCLLACSTLSFFAAIARVPLANAIGVFFAYPFVILALSALFLGEAIGALRWALVATGFLGSLLVAHVNGFVVSAGSLFALLAALAYAAALMVTRNLSLEVPPLVTSALSAGIGAIIFSSIVPIVWQMPSRADWLLMCVMGALAALGHFLIVAAHRYATAARLAPFGYSEIGATTVYGRLVFGDWPDSVVWSGIALIVASGVTASWLERKKC